MDDRTLDRIIDFVELRNSERLLFTAGPAPLLAENISGLRSCFGRGDKNYLAIEEKVMNDLKRISGHDRLVRMQGSASLAIEIMIRNFLVGDVLIVDTGHYSDRVQSMVKMAAASQGEVRTINTTHWTALSTLKDKYDWIVACATDTSTGVKLPIHALRQLADRAGARLMLDATASIGLEDAHELADTLAFSSCKGLFGLTGAAFIASHDLPTVEVDSFYLNYTNHLDKQMTGPYHPILSLANVLPRHADYREAVLINKHVFSKKARTYMPIPASNQPLLCTRVTRMITSSDPAAVLYFSRYPISGSVVCHLGEVHLGRQARGDILKALELTK